VTTDRRGTPTPTVAPTAARLRGRDRAVEQLDALVAAVVGGGSRVLLVRGDAGIGKTALLDHVADPMPGPTVLRVTGVPSERHLPLAGLLAVARPLAGHVAGLPPVQAHSLGAAWGAEAGGPEADGPGDPYSLYAGTLGLLAAAAEEAPLLVLVDDLQWLDASSGAALLFAARRLDHEGIGMIFAVRDGEDVELDLRGLPELRLTGLDDAAARELVTDRAGTVPADATLARLLGTAGGNPLALHELTARLDGPQLAGRAPLPDPQVLGPRLGGLYAQRLGALPDHTRRALLVTAVCDSGHLGTVVRACGHEGLDPDALDPAETAGLIAVGADRIAFRHPLVRAAVLGAATASRRRDAHLVLAEVYAEDPARHAWHRSWAVPGPDEEVAAALERAAGAGAARGGLSESATLLERAAALSPGPEDGARRLATAARHRLVSGHVGPVADLCDAALAGTADPALRARLVRMRAQTRLLTGAGIRNAIDDLLAEADRTDDPTASASLLCEAATAQVTSGDAGAALRSARRARALTRGADTTLARVTEVLLVSALAFNGLDREAATLAEPILDRFDAVSPSIEANWSSLLGSALHSMERYEQAESIMRRVVAAARSRSAVTLLPVPLAVLAYIELRTGATAAAHANASDAVRLARDVGDGMQHASTQSVLAWVEAVRGDGTACRTAAAAAIGAATDGEAINTGIVAHAALGFLALGEGRPDRALASLQEACRLSDRHGVPAQHWLPWQPDLVEVHLARGERPQAQEILDRIQCGAPGTTSSGVRALAARCRGMLATDDEADEAFARALDLHGATPTPIERARTLLCWGAQLRRAGRRVEAREQLRAAVEVYERIGVPQWAARARRELAATGERSRRRAPDTEVELTPQEMQIALAVADGATNREAAAALFLSPKTVENHLGRVYAKLGVRSRTELAARLRAAPSR
jgi:DNA-binding CsgD family transcriptional regulator